MRRIGVIAPLAADPQRSVPARPAAGRLERRAQRQHRISLGWIGEAARRHAAELVALAPDVILAGGSQAATPLVQITQTIPVVFVHTPRPGRIGPGQQLGPAGRQRHRFYSVRIWHRRKMAELLRGDRCRPRRERRSFAIRAITAGIGMFGAIQSAAPSLGVEVSPVNVRDPSEMERGITAFARFGNGGLIVTASALTRSRLLGIARSTRQSRCRASAPYRAAGSLTVIRQRVRGSAASVSVAEWSVDKSSQSTTSPTS